MVDFFEALRQLGAGRPDVQVRPAGRPAGAAAAAAQDPEERKRAAGGPSSAPSRSSAAGGPLRFFTATSAAADVMTAMLGDQVGVLLSFYGSEMKRMY